MVLPRHLPKDSHSNKTLHFYQRIFHNFLYYNGPLEPVLNFILLVPIYIFFLSRLGISRRGFVFFICVALSFFAEFSQHVIPGRVSSLTDLMLNIAGVATTAQILEHLKSWRMHRN